MTLAVAVDFGTSSTCVALSVDEQPARVVVIDGSPLMPSAVYADGRTLFVGAEADRQASLDPSCYEPTPKRRIDEGSLLLGDTVVAVPRVIAAVLSRAVREARTLAGGAAVDVLVLTHPADWGTRRIQLLTSAAAGLATRITVLPEPVAAAVEHGAGVPDGALLAVLDIGAGTTDVSVLRRGEDRFRVLATRGDPNFGGADVDQLLLDELGRRLPLEHRAAWEAVHVSQELDARRQRRGLRIDVRGAKESLSRHSYADVPLPGGLADGHLTRAELERLIHARAESVVDLLAAALHDAELRAAETAPAGAHPKTKPAEVFLVGGSSRIPLFATTVHRRLGVLPVSTDQPETVVARGALRALAAEARHPRPVPEPVTAPVQRRADEGTGPAVASGTAGPVGNTSPSSVLGRRRGRLLAAGLLLLAAAAVAVALVSWLGNGPGSRVVAARRVSFAVPADWQESRRTELGSNAELDLTPDGSATQNSGLFLVQTALDAVVSQPELARALQAQIGTETQAGKRYAAFDGSARYADREVITYREIRRDTRVVDWYVLLQDRLQVSVGCQHAATDQAAIAQLCAQAVRSVRVAGG